jgi:hypothetical protein
MTKFRLAELVYAFSSDPKQLNLPLAKISFPNPGFRSLRLLLTNCLGLLLTNCLGLTLTSLLGLRVGTPLSPEIFLKSKLNLPPCPTCPSLLTNFWPDPPSYGFPTSISDFFPLRPPAFCSANFRSLIFNSRRKFPTKFGVE